MLYGKCNARVQVIWFPPQPFENTRAFFLIWTCNENMTIEDITKEIKRRLSFIQDSLIGQSPENLERHYKLIGAQDAFKGILKFIEDGNGANIQD